MPVVVAAMLYAPNEIFSEEDVVAQVIIPTSNCATSPNRSVKVLR